MTIPVLSLRDYTEGTPDARAAFVRAWGAGLREFGFVALTEHGIAPEVADAARQAFVDFFALPDDVKRAYAKDQGRRGYTPFGVETAKDAMVADLKEFWHVGRELPAGDPRVAAYGANLWPAEVPAFRDAMLALYAQLDVCAVHLMTALAEDMGLDPAHLTAAVDGGNSVLRGLHYPALPPDRDPAAVRAAAHEDINMITILLAASDGGLEILTRDGTWMAVANTPGAVIVDSGDMLQRLTNGIVPATTHRVVNPPGAAGARYSLPFFCHPTNDFSLAPLDACVAASGGERRYPPITAGEYLVERLKQNKLK